MACIQIEGSGSLLAVTPTALEVVGVMPDLFQGRTWMASKVAFLLVVAGMFGLTGASIARRLHDSGRSLLWAVPPAVMLTVVGSLMLYCFAHIPTDKADPDGFLRMIGLVLAYLVSLIPLLAFLSVDGDASANRYGIAPAGMARLS